MEYIVNFYRNGELITSGHGAAENAEEAKEKAIWKLMLMFSRIDIGSCERIEAFEK